MKKISKILIAAVLGFTLTLAGAISVSATDLEGLTPGFWKNHTEAWADTGFSPTDQIGSIFNVPDEYNLDDFTLLEALSFGGGKGEIGAAKILLRASVAAILNAGDPDIKYYYLLSSIYSNTNAELNSHNRADMLWLAGVWDSYNNFGLH
ncbi:hypothetical protein [Dehalogenimonas etheniformans]|uniref:Uncharacterized protein n=1 Tax=Dehalogenimonas etheniformans TaxID=1536648 RepID=A0A2P5P5Y0_9CHLR|nr:hypothetical protein [Dehalogenimonas etheniformans]PPD57702.1 hypothetical protein JP09_008150 [Dehalogenimonas etheniformans]QNT76042.1 hypothetical protein HX448_04720 [Dehalogenimonas etheniformans]